MEGLNLRTVWCSEYQSRGSAAIGRRRSCLGRRGLGGGTCIESGNRIRLTNHSTTCNRGWLGSLRRWFCQGRWHGSINGCFICKHLREVEEQVLVAGLNFVKDPFIFGNHFAAGGVVICSCKPFNSLSGKEAFDAIWVLLVGDGEVFEVREEAGNSHACLIRKFWRNNKNKPSLLRPVSMLHCKEELAIFVSWFR